VPEFKETFVVRRRILAYLMEHPGCTLIEVGKSVCSIGYSSYQFTTEMAALTEEGLVIADFSRYPTEAVAYSVSENYMLHAKTLIEYNI